MTHEQFKQASDFWKSKDINEAKAMPEDELKAAVDNYLRESSVCALATGTGDYVRCTPLEYSYHDGKFWIFTEGGEKFIGLEKNDNVSLAVFEKTPGFDALKSVQVMGKAELIEEMSEIYIDHANYKKIPVAALKKLYDEGRPMHLICIKPVRMDVLFSEFKKIGYDARQEIVSEE